jgi:cytochrome c oxidase cbb3-type subunit I/II
MWKQFNPDGTLTYGNFLETVTQIMPMYWMRAIGGTLYLIGMLVLVYNIAKTIMVNETIEDELAEAPELQKISSSRIKGEKFHPWLEKTNSINNFGYNRHFDWWGYPDCTY